MAAYAGPAFGEGLLDGGNARAPDGTAKAVPAGSRRQIGPSESVRRMSVTSSPESG